MTTEASYANQSNQPLTTMKTTAEEPLIRTWSLIPQTLGFREKMFNRKKVWGRGILHTPKSQNRQKDTMVPYASD